MCDTIVSTLEVVENSHSSDFTVSLPIYVEISFVNKGNTDSQSFTLVSERTNVRCDDTNVFFPLQMSADPMFRLKHLYHLVGPRPDSVFFYPIKIPTEVLVVQSDSNLYVSICLSSRNIRLDVWILKDCCVKKGWFFYISYCNLIRKPKINDLFLSKNVMIIVCICICIIFVFYFVIIENKF